MKEKLYVIVSSQEYNYANHKNLWIELSKFHKVVVVNIAADYLVSVLKGKKYRIVEARQKPKWENANLAIVRPIYFLRPELLPAFFKFYISKVFWNSVARCFPEYRNYSINCIIYNPEWTRIVDFSKLDTKVAYYLYDEMRYNGKDNSINKKRFSDDEYACLHSDIIFTMTDVLAESRRDSNDNIVVLGNGGSYQPYEVPSIHFNNSVAFIGNFRNWIDNDLLEGLIKKRNDLLFCFAGTSEPDMKCFLEHLLNSYDNTLFLGKYSKDRMIQLYRSFSAVIIPYRYNQFIQATRPIKIVESVLAGTPVVTIPMNGYKESSFIRFAKTVDEFSGQIDFLIDNPIDLESDSYNEFVNCNTWKAKANIIENEMSNLICR